MPENAGMRYKRLKRLQSDGFSIKYPSSRESAQNSWNVPEFSKYPQRPKGIPAYMVIALPVRTQRLDLRLGFGLHHDLHLRHPVVAAQVEIKSKT